MGILSRFKKNKETELPPGAGVGYGDFNTPKGKYPILASTGKGNGIDGWAPRIGVNLPSVPDQDKLLVHYDLEKPDDPGHPSPFWTQRNKARLQLGSAEQLQTGTGNGRDSWEVDSQKYKAADDPKRTPVPNYRPTQTMSPSDYRFRAPMRAGRGDVPHLDGTHFSMANMRRTYPIRGMRPSQHFRNTFRLEPPPRDAQSVDLPSNMPTVPAHEVVSPNVMAPTARGSFRL